MSTPRPAALVFRNERRTGRLLRASHQEARMSTHLAPRDVSLHHLVKVVSAGFLHNNVNVVALYLTSMLLGDSPVSCQYTVLRHTSTRQPSDPFMAPPRISYHYGDCQVAIISISPPPLPLIAFSCKEDLSPFQCTHVCVY